MPKAKKKICFYSKFLGADGRQSFHMGANDLRRAAWLLCSTWTCAGNQRLGLLALALHGNKVGKNKPHSSGETRGAQAGRFWVQPPPQRVSPSVVGVSPQLPDHLTRSPDPTHMNQKPREQTPAGKEQPDERSRPVFSK